MKKILTILLVLLVLLLVTCTQQIIKQEMTFLENNTFDEVWEASIKAVNDIEFTIDSLDKDAGFIAAESGRQVGQKDPPRMAIMIKKVGGKVSVDCKVLQKEFVDIFGHGKKAVRKFMTALNLNLNR
ncbi:MAG: hypothetical protein WBC02_08440 [Candidatus Aminicenantaceae bacterium]